MAELPPSAQELANPYPRTPIEPDIMEMVRERPPGIAWLRFPLSKRLGMMEAIVDMNIGLFENDCFGWTRSKFFKKTDAVDPSGIRIGGEDGAAHDAPHSTDPTIEP